MKYPAAYTTDEHGEAQGLRWFCHVDCKVAYAERERTISIPDANVHEDMVGDEATYCDECGAELRRDRPVFIVAVYDVGQRYGGHEEGGWWYDAGSLVRVMRRFRSSKAAYRYSNRLNERLKSRTFGPNEGKRDYTSVLSDGEFRACTFEGTAPAGFPDRKPRYE